MEPLKREILEFKLLEGWRLGSGEDEGDSSPEV